MCEIQEKYQAKAVAEAKLQTAIETTIETATELGAGKSFVLKKLTTQYGLTENEAFAKIQQYAPSLM